jgi:hypothetical protein
MISIFIIEKAPLIVSVTQIPAYSYPIQKESDIVVTAMQENP